VWQVRLERILFVTGLFLLSVWVAGSLGARVMHSLESRRLEEALRSAHATETDGRPQDRVEAGEPGFLANHSRERAAEGQSIGLLEIPRLGVSATIAEGTGKLTLLYCIGHVEGTSFPGESGNAGLAGHRDSVFRKLKEVEVGDRIHIVTPDGAFEYRTASTEVVERTDTDVLDPTEQATLTLVTCYPFHMIGPAPRRFIVRAYLVTSSGTALVGVEEGDEGQKVGASHGESEQL
jgi:sortase A